MSVGIGRERQFEIYVGGARGTYPAVPVSFERLEQAARKAMSPEGFAYVAGGAGTEETMRENRAAFERWRIVPRMLRDVSVRATATEVLGTALPSPFVLCPIGVLEMAHRDADVAVARAAATEGIPFVFSNQASRPMEEAALAMGDAPRWFQLYWSTSNELVASLVSRAERCGCSAIVLTLDTTMLGWRIRDLDLAYLPFLRGKGIAQYTSDPVFVEALQETLRQEAPATGRITLAAVGTLLGQAGSYPGSRLANVRSGLARAAVRRFVETYSRPSLSWDDLAFLRDRTRLPILLKGILHPADAVAAVEHGMDGIVVSNHGGRQVDGAIATMDALPAVVEAVGGRVPVLLDSGVRSGADVFRALALGASAVGLGRPYVWGARRRRRGRRARGRPQPARRLRPHHGPRRGCFRARHRARQRHARLSAIEAVVFDLDGVLVDSEHVWDEVREELARERGGRWHERAQADMMGMSSTEWSRYMHDVVGLSASPDEINDEVVQRMRARYTDDLPLIDGAVEAVERLAGSFRLALASSSNRPLIDAVLVEAGLERFFEATVSSEEVARGKPAPDVFLEAARRLGVAAERCAAIEDSGNGLRAAHAAGMRVIAIPNRRYPPPAEALALANVRLDSLDDLSPEVVDG